MEWFTPALGYLASFLLALSLLVNNALRFRWINMAGGISFIIYGLLIDTFPIVLTNSVLLAINIYRLIALYRSREVFDFLPIQKGDRVITRFMRIHRRDIQSYFPGYEFTDDTGRICFVILRDFALSNLFIARLEANGDAIVELNYTIPKYRDYKVGRFIFETGKSHLLSRGIKRIIYDRPVHRKHEWFLRKMDFRKTEMGGSIVLVREL